MTKSPSRAPAFASLVDAIQRGDLAALRARLEGAVDVDAAPPGREPALWYARRSAAMMRLLLDAGADPDARIVRDPRRSTLLMILAESVGDEPAERMRLLVKSGAELDARDAEGETALFYATRAARPDLLGLLLSLGANPNLTHRGGMSVLLVALRALEREAEGASDLIFADVHRAVLDLIRRYGSDEAARINLDLERAVRARDLPRVEALLRAGANPSFCPDVSVLALAAEAGDLAIARVLVDAGADLDLAIEGATPLELAAVGGHLEVARLLVEAGASSASGAPLVLARVYGQRDVADYLELPERWAEIRGRRRTSCSKDQALFGAVALGDLAGVERALADGAEISAEQGGRSVLEHAFESRAPDAVILRLLAAGADVRRVRNQILWAARVAPAPVIRAFVEAGADIDLASRSGRPLQLAARRGDLTCLRAFIEAGADLDAEGPAGCALSDAVLYGHGECAEALLQAGARVEVARAFQPLLALAASRGQVSLVKALLDAGEDPRASPLILAASSGHTDVVRVLIARGASLEGRDEAGKTALQRARELGRTEVVEILLGAGAVSHPPLSATEALALAVEGRDRDAARAAIAAGAELEARMGQGRRTALFAAVELGDRALVDLLITSGARVDARDASGATPLFRAAGLSDAAILRRLVAAGAELDARNGAAETALVAAVEAGRTETARALLELGADPNAEDARGATPLMRAVRGSEALLRALLAAGADPDRLDRRGRSARDRAQVAGARVVRLFSLFPPRGGSTPRPRDAIPPKRLPRPVDVTAYEQESVRRRLAERMREARVLGALTQLEGETGSKARPVDVLGGHELHVRASKVLNVAEVQARFLHHGCFVFAAATRGAVRNPDRLVVLATDDKLEAVAAMGTPGTGQEIGFKELLRYLADLDARHPFRLTEIRADLLAGEFLGPLDDPRWIAEEMVALCSPGAPDAEDDADALAERLAAREPFLLSWE